MSVRKVASHYLRLPDGTFLRQQVVKLSDGQVVEYYALKGEQEDVEWFPGGIIELCETDGPVCTAYFVSPYNLTQMKPVDGTRRTRLK